MTFEELYFVLSLLGICYRPMRKMRSLHISFTDGIHSLERISQFLNAQEEKSSEHYQMTTDIREDQEMVIA